METLKKNSKGESVKILQNLLGIKEDGIFGNNTEKSVIEFQKSHNLTPDGIVGPKTWEALQLPPSTKQYKFNLKKTSKRKINGIILHCSATREGQDFTTNTIKKWHLERGFSDIGYHYVIYRDGSVNLGRDIDLSGAHTSGYNSKTIGICYIGGCDQNLKSKDTRTEAQKKTLIELVNQLMDMYNLTPKDVYGHYQFANKSCPSFKIEPFRDSL